MELISQECFEIEVIHAGGALDSTVALIDVPLTVAVSLVPSALGEF